MTVRPTLTHAGIYTRDLEAMAVFYKQVLGLIETDRGVGITVPRSLIFLSSDPAHHHQFVLSDGRPAGVPSTVNQISFLVKSLDEMRAIKRQAENHGVRDGTTVNHGNAWSLCGMVMPLSFKPNQGVTLIRWMRRVVPRRWLSSC